MAITLTADEIRDGARIHPDALTADRLTQLVDTAKEIVERYAPAAPSSVANEAAIRITGYLFETARTSADITEMTPQAYATNYQPLHHSGAGSLLAPYRQHRAGAL